jgi:hypothetical protein
MTPGMVLDLRTVNGDASVLKAVDGEAMTELARAVPN